MAKPHAARASIRRVTSGLCDTLTNFLLLELFFNLEFIDAGFSARRMLRAESRALDLLDQCNATTIRRAFRHLFRRGFVETIRGAVARHRITQAGRQWLEERYPRYHTDRPWDRRMHLVTYDVPERKHRHARDDLRDFLRQLRCAPLQASVWITPYNPRTLLREHLREHRVPGVIIAEFGKGSAIGEGSYRDLVERAYRLHVLNERYSGFLDVYRKQRRDADAMEIASAFTTILQEDPQLPFELLPTYWRGDDAYAFTRRRCQKSMCV